MLFNSPEYFAFLAGVLILYYSLGQRWQNRMLLVASYLFYAFWDYRFLSLIFLSTVVDYLCARALEHERRPGRRKLLLGTSILVNLGILGFFKYFNFFAENAQRVLSLLGLEVSLPVLYVILPVGISFYTFQTMAYTIDVYRGKMRPVHRFLDFALYVSYFPQLVAGPIERPQRLLPALQSKRVVSSEHMATGALLILIGLFRKIVIADGIGAQVDAVFAQPERYSSPELMKGIYLFALQIYCDFAGYTDIARGTSRLLGIELMENFQRPYFASNIRDFWRRWHISLSTWLRDYLYIPLGGSRKGPLRTYVNLMITMLLGGLWHGAAWTFVIWGGLHGLYLSVHRWLHTRLTALRIEQLPPWVLSGGRVLGIVLTFHLVLFSWVFFRAPGLRTAIGYLEHTFSLEGMETWIAVLPSVAIPWLLVLLIDLPQSLANSHTAMLSWPRPLRHGVVAMLLFLVLMGIGTRAPFIYFQF